MYYYADDRDHSVAHAAALTRLAMLMMHCHAALVPAHIQLWLGIIVSVMSWLVALIVGVQHVSISIMVAQQSWEHAGQEHIEAHQGHISAQ